MICVTYIIVEFPVSVAPLVATRDNLCRGQGSNSGFPTSPHIMCMNLATRLHDKKKMLRQTTTITEKLNATA